MRLIDADALKEFIDDCGICAICPQRAPRCSYDCDFPDIVTEKWNIAIDAQPTIDAVSEWIPCSERLPSNFSEDETVLATTDVDGDRVIAMFALDVKSFYLKGYVSAWMPLPEPYGEREGE